MTTVTQTQAMKLALEALEICKPEHPNHTPSRRIYNSAITSLQEALAQPQQEPVAWIYKMGPAKTVSMNYVPGVRATPLYTSPPAQQEPVAKLKLIGWRTSDYLMETSDGDKAKNWEVHYEMLPIFEGDPHTKLAAPQQDIPDLIAGALGVSRGTAYDMMREALAEQQEPCCYGGIAHDCHAGPGCRIAERIKANSRKPAQRKPLTDEEIRNIWSNGDCFEEIAFARAIEAAHGIK